LASVPPVVPPTNDGVWLSPRALNDCRVAAASRLTFAVRLSAISLSAFSPGTAPAILRANASLT
jgi:hypothetical protein